LKAGDIVSIDVGANYCGYYSDAARSYGVGEISPQAQRLLQVTKESFYESLKYAQEGYHVGDICASIGEYVAANGYSVPTEYSGHGLGSNLHEAPTIPNYGKRGSGALLKAGMVLAIEPMVLSGKADTVIGDDRWAVSAKDGKLNAHYENTVLIGKDDCEILSIKEG
jgi:methionyl aminopeptidase